MESRLSTLFRLWKKEIQNTKGAMRSTSYTMFAAPYIPYDVLERKTSEISTSRKRALATIMGVGEVLAKVRTMLATEEGELDVDEDEHGLSYYMLFLDPFQHFSLSFCPFISINCYQ